MESSDNSVLKWENFDSVLGHNFIKFLKEKKFCDVSLASGDAVIRAHKIMLATCSPYFERIFETTGDLSSPVIVLNEIRHEDLVKMLDFCYKGKVTIPNKDIERFMKVAKMLQLKGMTNCKRSDMNKVPIVRHQMPSKSPSSDNSSPAAANDIPLHELMTPSTLFDELDELIQNNPFFVKPEPATPDEKTLKSKIKRERRQSIKREADDGKIYLKQKKNIILIILPSTDLGSPAPGQSRKKQKKAGIESPNETTPKVSCRYCDKKYSKPYLLGHKKTCKENPDRIKFDCHLCGKELSRKDKLASHIRVVHSRRESI